MMNPPVVLTGDIRTPRVEIHPPRLPRPVAEQVTAWVKNLPDRSWDTSRRVWVVTGFGAGADPEKVLAGFGLVAVGPDGGPANLNVLMIPVAVQDDPGWVRIFPRLAGKKSVAGYAGPDAVWRPDTGCFMTRAAALANGPDGWCLIDPKILSNTAPDSHPVNASTQSVARGSGLRPVPADHTPTPGPGGGGDGGGGGLRVPDAPSFAPLVFDGSIDGLRGVPLVDLAAVSPTAATAMLGVGLHNVYDLLHCTPRDYIDLTNPRLVDDAPPGEKVAILGTVAKATYDRDRKMMKATVRDAAGVNVFARWFSMPWLQDKVNVGGTVLLHGKVEGFSGSNGFTGKSMTNPLVDVIAADQKKGLLGVYPASGKHEVTTWLLHRACVEASQRIGALTDPVPDALLTLRGLPARTDAFRMVHAPQTKTEAETGRERLKYDELLRLQLALLVAREAQHAEPSVAHTPSGQLTGQLLAALPFTPTGAQGRAFAEITADMASPTAMNRLLQGDVGAGKTIVALHSMLTAQESGHQAALVAPTEILASQHYEEIVRLLGHITGSDGQPVRVALLTNRVTGKARKQVLADLASGDVGLVVGTHAVFADKVVFESLGLVIIDEQHRFGSEQRRIMLDKGAVRPDGTRALPDILYCTATPIPRTAMMTVFGDLDVSILDEKPAGRTPIKTVHVDAEDGNVEDADAPTWVHVRNEVAAGRQAFVLCPLRDSLTAEAASAGFTAERLRQTSLAGLRVEVVTGKQPAEERREVMGRFETGEIDVLVATTVIEVGVNVPNATVMVVLDADRFGLAQLHQVRGRVGRGQHPGTCYLVATPKTSAGEERLAALVASDDGFALAEKDLEIRGAGSVLGAMQSGTTRDLRVANIVQDVELLAAAKADAALIVAEDPRLARRPQLRSEIDLVLGDEGTKWLLSA